MSQAPELESSYAIDKPDSPAKVHVRLGLVYHLGFELLEALKSIPKRGLEIGGILLGRVVPAGREGGRPTVFVDGYETVESEHEYGPAYEFSARDRLLFEQAVSRRRNQPAGEPRPVGFFRSLTSPELEFNEQDLGIARDLFTRQPAIGLLVKPFVDRPGAARLGIWNNDAFHPLETFPFKVSALLDGGFPVVAPQAAGAAAPKPAPAMRAAGKQAVIPHVWNSWTLSAMAAAMLIAAAAIWARSHGSGDSQPTRAVQAGDTGVSLHVERRDGSAILTWNRSAVDAQKAQNALLVITDGDKQTQLRLDRAELETGRVVYVPRSADVNFQLQLSGPGRSSTESVRSTSESADVAAAVNTPPPPAVAPAHRVEKDDASDEASEPVPKPTFRVFSPAVVTPPTIPAPPAVTAPPASVASLAAIGARPAVRQSAPPLAPAPKLITTVTVEPVGRSAWKRVFGKISPEHLFRADDSDGATPPRAVREVQPRLSDDLVSQINGAAAVDVKVFIGRSGAVVRTELKEHDVNDRIADAVVQAARNWKFEPARNDDGPVEGLALLHFQLRRSGAAPVVANY